MVCPQADCTPVRKQRLDRLDRGGVVGLAILGHDHRGIADIEVHVAGRDDLAVASHRARRRDGDDFKLCVQKGLGGIGKGGNIGIVRDRLGDRDPPGSNEACKIVDVAVGVIVEQAVAKPDDTGRAEVALKAGYRQNGTFVMNRKTQAAIRKFKDSGGAYLWQPPAQAGGRASLMTFPLIEAEDMPDIGANSLSVAFGDFRRGYLIVDRVGVRVLRDPYSAKPYVLFYTTKRVGGGVQDFDAIKLMKFAAS